jgi:hypothetical protein
MDDWVENGDEMRLYRAKPRLFMKKGVKASVCLHYGEKSELSNEN